jgi:hypothetical protein
MLPARANTAQRLPRRAIAGVRSTHRCPARRGATAGVDAAEVVATVSTEPPASEPALTLLLPMGVLRATLTQRFSPIHAANLKKVHAVIESARTRGKLVLVDDPVMRLIEDADDAIGARINEDAVAADEGGARPWMWRDGRALRRDLAGRDRASIARLFLRRRKGTPIGAAPRGRGWLPRRGPFEICTHRAPDLSLILRVADGRERQGGRQESDI